uniref:PHD-type domain-containing protein n=1 Tax=viral metagenome TaxID=1070528 RepID=A0A6C0KQ36_9ZZZZ
MPSTYIYTRVSSKRQGEANHVSLDAQLEKCMTYLDSEPTSVFSETTSGRVLQKQNALMSLVEIVTSGDIIVVYNVSRFTRDAAYGIDLLNDFYKRRISVLSVTEGINSIANRVSFRTKLVEANEESDVISDRVRGATEFIKQHGGYIGVAPYGEMTVRSTEPAIEGGNYHPLILQPNPMEMGVVKRILYHVDNRTHLDDIIESQPDKRLRVGICNLIADMLNDEGIHRRGKQWTSQSVKAIYNKFKDDESLVSSIEEIEGQLCEICQEGHSESGNEMVLCDKCDKGYHINCIHLKKVPKKSFFCSVLCQYSNLSLHMEE